MIDPGTGLTVLGTAIGGAKVVEKILGPTAEYVGVGLKNWTQKRVENVARILDKTREKLGDEINKPGGVPPKVLKEVLDEGSYCDDELTAEYFGGVLASARTGNSRDDRAAAYMKVTADLSTYQIRFHYITYSCCRQLFLESGLTPTHADDRQKMSMYMKYDFLLRAMDFERGEPAENILIHATSGLNRAGLLDLGGWGPSQHLNANFGRPGWNEFSSPGGYLVAPTQFGVEYWLWAIGAGDISPTFFLTADRKLPKLPEVQIQGSPDVVVKR